MSLDSKCSVSHGRVLPCAKRARIGPSEFAYGGAVHCAYCDMFLRNVEPVKGLR